MIVFRYLTKEVLKTQIAILLVLLAVFLSQNLVAVLSQASSGKFPASLVMTLLGLNLPNLLVLVLPLSLFLGVLLSLGRMYSESEMVVLHSVGVSEWYIARVMLLLSIIYMLITGGLSLFATPWAEQEQNRVLEQAQSEAGLAAVTQGRFQHSPNGRAVLFVEKIGRDNKLDKVFVAQLADPDDESDESNIVVAQGGSVVEDKTGEQRLKLYDGVQYQITPKSVDFQIVEFGQYEMQIKEQQADERRLKMSALPLNELLASDDAEAIAEFHWRLALPIALPLMTLIAVPMARTNVRQGKFAKMLPAILLYLGYFGLMVAGRKALEDDVVPHFLGMWWIHFSVLLVAITLLGKERPAGAKLSHLIRRRWVAK